MTPRLLLLTGLLGVAACGPPARVSAGASDGGSAGDGGPSPRVDGGNPVLSLSSISPSTAEAGALFAVSGHGFAANAQVFFGSTAATGVAVTMDGTEATGQVPAKGATDPTTVSVTVQNAPGVSASLPNAFTYGAPHTVSWCQISAPTSVTALAGSPSPKLMAEAYSAGITPGGGQAKGLTGQVGYGASGSDGSTWSWSDATYASDQGNNDLFTGTLTSAVAGSHAFAFRFSLDGNQSFVYCDTVGPDTGSTVAAPGTLIVQAAPTITGVTPSEAAAGATVTVTGTGFVAGTTFSFGPNAATGVMLAGNGLSATMTLPAGSGSVPVTANLDGSSVSWTGMFVYDIAVNWCQLEAPTTETLFLGQPTPTLSAQVYQPGLTPGGGSAQGLLGQVGFGAASATPDTWLWTTAAYASDSGNNDVFTGTVTPTATGASLFAFRFSADGHTWTYCDSTGPNFMAAQAGTLTVLPAMTITGVAPSQGRPGDTVTVTGTGLSSGARFDFGGTAATSVLVAMNGTTATLIVPAGTGAVSVTATLEGATVSWSGQFTYETSWCQLQSPASVTLLLGQTTPVLSAQIYQPGVTPTGVAPQSLTAQVGYGLTTADGALWSWSNASYSAETGNNDVFSGQLVPAAAGSFGLAFRFSADGNQTFTYCDTVGPDHGSAVAAPGTLAVAPKPNITGVAPTHALAGSVVTVGGTGFASGMTFNFGSASASNVVVPAGGESAIVTVPAGTGVVTISATLDGIGATGSAQFTYDVPTTHPPTVTGFSPAFVPVTGGSLTISGTNYDSGATVSIGGQAATVTSWTSTSLSVTVPAAAAAGAVSVAVADNGSTATATSTLDYVLKFSITVDGDLSDWPAAALVATGDPAATNWAATNTLGQLYLGYDDTNLYIGIQGTVESQNALIGYLSVSGQTWGSNNIAGTLSDHSTPADLDDELSSVFTVADSTFLAQFGYGLFGAAANLDDGIASQIGARSFSNPADLAWINSTVASTSTAVEVAIPWQTSGTGADLFVPFPMGAGDPMTIRTFARIVSCGGTCFSNQGLPVDPNLASMVTATEETVSAVGSIEIR